ncbi:MAG TPA: phytanoyl-CoA dioxygenase family protein [Coleofasciculaceae cyanobacterium]|jgi:hypothetical protein
MPISLVLSFCPFNLSTTELLARKEDLYPQAKQLGYVLIPELLSATQAQEARSLILKLAEEERQQGKLLIDGERERLFNLVYKGEIFEFMVQHPRVIEIIEAILGEDMTLGGFSAHILNPGATNMGMHVDYPYWTMRLPFPASPVMEVQVIWMVEDFTEDNGAPIFAPGSQKFCSPPDLEHFFKVAQKVTGKQVQWSFPTVCVGTILLLILLKSQEYRFLATILLSSCVLFKIRHANCGKK